MAWEEKKWRIQLLLLAVTSVVCMQRVKRRVRDVCVSVHACVQEVRER